MHIYLLIHSFLYPFRNISSVFTEPVYVANTMPGIKDKNMRKTWSLLRQPDTN